MTEPNDFVVYDGTEDGLPVRRELSCGSIPYVRARHAIWLLSATGEQGTWHLPKGRIKIVDGFPEGPLECAIRETQEELSFLADMPLEFNGFYASVTARKDTAAPARAYKRIALFGLDVPATAISVLSRDAPHRIVPLQEVLAVIDPQYADALRQFSAFVEKR